VSVRPSVCLSVCHKLVFSQNGGTDRPRFGIQSTDGRRLLIRLSVHLCVPRDGRDAACRAALSASAVTCFGAATGDGTCRTNDAALSVVMYFFQTNLHAGGGWPGGLDARLCRFQTNLGVRLTTWHGICHSRVWQLSPTMTTGRSDQTSDVSVTLTENETKTIRMMKVFEWKLFIHFLICWLILKVEIMWQTVLLRLINILTYLLQRPFISSHESDLN